MIPVEMTEASWVGNLEAEIDARIAALSRDRDVITVTLTPLTQTLPRHMELKTRTTGLIVTVIWREVNG